MAGWLRQTLTEHSDSNVVCLAAEDKGLIAAALLASLAGGPVLLLPYSFSPQALAAMQQTTGYTLAIADVDRPFPGTTRVLCPPQDLAPADVSGWRLHDNREVLRLYTGGSTGTPQSWSKTGKNLFDEALFLARTFEVTPRDRIAATISPYHIYGLLYSVLLPLVSGASVLPGIPSFPEEIRSAIFDQAATILVSVPAHYRALRGKGCLGESLRLAFSSAGALDPEDNAVFCRDNPAGIVEVYGSTETGGIGLRNRSRGEEGFTPYATLIWTIREDRLCLRSPYLSPELPCDTDGFFATGDRVRGCGANSFLLQGRIDSITKVGGKRVDLEEIQALIRAEEGVRDCLVLSMPEGGGRGHRIVAVVEGERVDLEQLRTRLRTQCEPYAQPRAIKQVARIPVKENGKYDRDEILRLFGP
jgi:acyl-coenzyme A synthetase/AMP-(fatty) acid ligase